MYDMAKAISDAILKNIQRLSWKCENCTKVGECEEIPSPTGEKDFEARYCQSLIMAAIYEESSFQIPFSK